MAEWRGDALQWLSGVLLIAVLGCCLNASPSFSAALRAVGREPLFSLNILFTMLLLLLVSRCFCCSFSLILLLSNC